MFNSKTGATPPTTRPATDHLADPPPSRPLVGAAAAPSVLGPDLVFEGSVSGEGELQVQGNVKGEVRVARLIVGDQAQIEGVIRCGHVEVRGRVLGDIEAKTVKLYASAHVEGDIVHEQLSIDVGAFFQGRCQQAKRAPSAQVIELDKGGEKSAG
jgi:cytoskeletal protein CcmA (bactofilin family)